MSRLAFILLSILLPFILISLSSPYAPTEPFALENARDVPARVLLLTAHPDDECMFFAPTLLALTSAQRTKDSRAYDVFSLCMSSGNADGLGDVRKGELGRSLDVLGVPAGQRWVLDEPFVLSRPVHFLLGSRFVSCFVFCFGPPFFQLTGLVIQNIILLSSGRNSSTSPQTVLQS